MVGIQLIDKVFRIFDKSFFSFKTAAVFLPIGGVQVFAQVNAIWLYMAEKLFEGYNLLQHGMPAVINQDIKWRYFLYYLFQKIPVGLRADHYFYVFFFNLFAVGVYINTVNFCFVAKILFPHLQASALK